MNIGIIGAGATGLSAAYYLSKEGHEVTVFEADKQCGGIASSFSVGNSMLERIYHHIFTNDIEIISLISELGLSDKLTWYKPRNAIYTGGRLYPFSTPFDLVRFPIIPVVQRIRLGLMVLNSRRLKEWKEIEAISAEEWIRKSAGDAVYNKLWGPLLESKFDRQSREISAAWLWNKFKLRGGSRDKTAGLEMLGYLDGSFQVLYDELKKRITAAGGRVLTKSKVTRLSPEPGGSIQVATQECAMSFDRVIATTAPEILLDIGGDCLSDPYKDKLSKISYMSNICMVLELSEPLSPYYWITVAENDSPFVLLIEHTSMMSSSAYGSHIVYLSRYLDANSELYSADDDFIKNLFIEKVAEMFPSMDRSNIRNAHIFRTRYAQPVVVRKYSELIPGFETPVDNLYLACMAQIFPEDRGQNHAIRLGKQIAVLAGSAKA